MAKLSSAQIEFAVAWWAMRWQKSASRETFANVLREQLVLADSEESPKSWTSDGVFRLHTDYDPFHELFEAAKAAEPTCRGCMYSCDGILPMKTQMNIFPDKIEVSEGRGGDWTIVWGIG